MEVFTDTYATEINEVRKVHLEKYILPYIDIESKTVVDIGCGGLVPFMDSLGGNPDCIDIRASNLEMVKKRYPECRTFELDLNI